VSATLTVAIAIQFPASYEIILPDGGTRIWDFPTTRQGVDLRIYSSVPEFVGRYIALKNLKNRCNSTYFCAVENHRADLPSKQQYCKNNALNIGCTFREKNKLGLCGKVTRSGMTPADQKVIVDAHNEFRRQVANGKTNQPPAANMLEIVSI
jgi:hypothetical protein